MAKQNVINLQEYLFDPATAMRHIRHLWKEGKLQPRGHAQDRMRKRNISIDHIGQVLRSGRVVDWSKPEDWWRYNVQGATIDGLRIECVVEIRRNLILVTVIDINKTIKKKK